MNDFQLRLSQDIDTLIEILSVTHPDIPSAIKLGDKVELIYDILSSPEFNILILTPALNDLRLLFTIKGYGKIDLIISNSYLHEDVFSIEDYADLLDKGEVFFHISRMEDDCLYHHEDKFSSMREQMEALQSEFLALRLYSITLFNAKKYDLLTPDQFEVDG